MMKIDMSSVITELTVEQFENIVFRSCALAIILFLFLALVLSALFFLFDKINKVDKERRKKELEECKNQAIREIFDYYDNSSYSANLDNNKEIKK